MKFGHFDDQRREYVITSPHTPLPWINYLGSDDFFTLVSNTAGGYCFYKDARLRRITRYRYNNCPLDNEGFRIYLRDGDTVWNVGLRPTETPLDSYECRHGMGYTVISGSLNGIVASQTMFVPKSENCLLNRLTIKNTTDTEKSIKAFPYVEFCLWDANDDATNFQRNYSIGEVEIENNAIYHKSEYRERRNHYAVFFSNVKTDAYDTSRDAFIGTYGTPAHPDAVFGEGCTNSWAHGWQPVGAFEFDLTLAPGEETSIIIGLGYIENDKDSKFIAPNVINKAKACDLIAKFTNDAQFDNAFNILKEFWDSLLAHYTIESADPKLNRMVNIWNQYQCMVTFNMSRSASYFESGVGRGMGFRDSCQDLLGFVHMIPEKARERILDIAATQFADGSAYHQYQPLTKRGNLAVGSGFNDDPLWLIAGVDAYLRETGDFDILKESVPFDNDESLAAPLMEHLRRSFNYICTHLGPHGLPLIGRADWNDCLNLNCFSENPGESFQTSGPSEGPVAESIFIAGMFVKYGKAYASICEHMNLGDEAAKVLESVERMNETVLKSGWDGEWFTRAYDAFGKPVGSHECEEGKIFIEPQGMCVMAGIGVETGQAATALKSVEKHLDTKYGVMLNQPAYTKYMLNLGEISSYPPGYKENASIFCHNNTWIISAETVLGHGNRAFDLYTRISPAYIEDISEIHRTEPYVFGQMIAGKDAATFGEGKNSWLSGTSSWTLYSLTQSILGIITELDGLRINPCIPDTLKSFKVSRIFRGATYNITVDNTAGVQSGIKSITVNKESVSSNLILAAAPGETVEATIVMG